MRLRLLRKADTSPKPIVEVAGEIKDRKGVNMPDTLLPMSAMTPKDRSRSGCGAGSWAWTGSRCPSCSGPKTWPN